jgi:hypothetical protein
MGFDKTFFPYFNSYCIDKLGSDLGEPVFIEAENKLSDMIKEADYRNNKSIRWHMDENMLPTIAIYLAFKKFDSTAMKAYEFTDEVLQISRLKAFKKNLSMGKLSFGYFAFKLFCKSIMMKQYPKQGWDMQWIRYDKNEIHFNMKSCIYYETTKKYNCTEMCPLFCANDDVILSGYKPAVVFERSGTIALGQDTCDFHFKNGKYIK